MKTHKTKWFLLLFAIVFPKPTIYYSQSDFRIEIISIIIINHKMLKKQNYIGNACRLDQHAINKSLPNTEVKSDRVTHKNKLKIQSTSA